MSQCEIAATNAHKKVNYINIPHYGFNTEKDKTHPCQKPIQLYKWLLMNYAQPDDLILDTHVGSASSLIACELMGYDYILAMRSTPVTTETLKSALYGN